MDKIYFEYYPLGLFTKEDCRKAVMIDWLTKDQYKELVGEDYDVVQPPTN
ncbi:hypothetical protein CANFE03_05420 [Ligilactobacillus animalis]